MIEFSQQSREQMQFGSQYPNLEQQQQRDEATTRRMIMNNATMEAAYATLGLPFFASPDEVKSQYRRLALTNHPDKVHGGALVKKVAHDQFARISAAYELLVCPELQQTTESPVLYASPFSDPYQLFRQSVGENGTITIPHPTTNGISGYLTAAAAPLSPEPVVMIKRMYEEISPPSSPITTATTFDSQQFMPALKRLKVHHAPPPPFLIRHSVKRDASWAVESPFDFVPSKRMRTSICT
jgi:hypothetical protein